tara:strand:- start:943 stop:1836 length:894 start_codon:yes stop_codon:yes gene_type:complete
MYNIDSKIRIAAMNHLDKLLSRKQSVLSYSELKNGFFFNEQKVYLIGPQGIFKPSQMELPLTITTTFNSPYQDKIGDAFLTYKYRGNSRKDIKHRENVGLRTCMHKNIPLIYFHGIEVGQYVPIYPVYIVRDILDQMEFLVAADQKEILMQSMVEDVSAQNSRRKYITREVKTRLQQQSFRVKIMKAYNESCAFCKLKHPNLLDAAHIVPDSENGTNEVQNGIALCKIHHAAFDQLIVGVDPDYKIHVREDILREIDGPMLKHGLQSLNNKKIHLPRGNKKPNQDYLSYKFEKFINA